MTSFEQWIAPSSELPPPWGTPPTTEQLRDAREGADVLARAAMCARARYSRSGPDWLAPLAVWLDDAADDAEQVGPDFRAVRFARAFLKEDAWPPTRSD